MIGSYRFSYLRSDEAYVGVMAQEVQKVMPGAVVNGDDGYLRVITTCWASAYSGRLGRGGQKVPALRQ
jgi:hypothetical protein